jgi:ubiquinol-cytochrome c reductase cytochrome b subunit
LRAHHLLDRPRDNPWRTGIGAAFFTWVATIFVAGSADRILISIGFSYVGQVWFFRFAAFFGPLILGAIAYRIASELRDSEAHPLRGWSGRRIVREPDGGFRELPPADDG